MKQKKSLTIKLKPHELEPKTLSRKYFWEPADNLMYRLFRKSDEDLHIFQSKIWLLARTYLTNIEKKITIEKLSNKLFSDGKLKLLLRKIRCYRKIRIEECLDYHKQLVKIIKKYTKTNEDVFAAKLLHFYKPRIFPILDSKAQKILSSIANIKEDIKANNKKFRLRYERFCNNLAALSEFIRKHFNLKLCPKQLDIYLYTKNK